MRLKSLEMQGFKSFPDKTQLIFGDGITAIVGPNGSGKSNISDAVRWVLGEQSTKTLRGGKMEDVIFGGTVKRSAVGFAEVSLTIDNSDGVLPTDYNEVTITRRYYRSGESEFYINRSAVRLRDIHELLMDTGLGRDGYSIIGQGRIDEILSLKSEDRREIFEEAAGISKFRHRKDESERKLSATEENLVRIRDIISELAAQVEPLEIQAEQARRYLQIFEELKSLEIDMWMYNLDRNSENTARLKNDYAIADSQFERASALVSELYDEVEAISADMRIKDGELEAARTRHHEAERARDEVQHQISVLEATGANNEENIARIEAELCDEVGRAGGIDEQISERQARIDELTEREHVLEAEIAERAASIAGAAESSGDAAAVLESLRASMGARASESAQVQIEKSAADAELLGIDDRRAQIALRISERDASINDAKMRESELKHALAEAEDTCASVSNILAGCDIKRKKKTERVEELSASLSKLNAETQAMEHKLSVLADLERDMEGFSFAVKTVLRAGERGALPGVHGTVAKLMSVPDKYTVAIETILGGALQNIVVSDEAAAKAAIAMLKSGNGGRATFLPLTTIKSSRVRENGIEKHNGFVGIASDLVSFDEKYAGIFGSVLGRVVVTENIDCATSLARAFGYRFRIVTLDGQVINAGGSFTGGSTSKSAGILTRANEINRLKDEISKSHTRRQQLDGDKCEAASELSKFMFDIEVYENDKRRAEDVRLRVSTELSHFAAAESDMDGERAALDAENEKLSERRCARIHDVAAMAERIAELEAEVREMSDKIELALLENEELSKARGTLSGELALLREEAAGAAAERVSLIQSRSELMALHDAIKGGSEQKRRLITEYRERNEAIAGEIVTMGEQVAEFNAGLSSVAAEISSIAEEKMKLEALRNKKDKESKSKNDEILNLERERARIASKKDAAESEERQITDKLWETYELTVSAARELRRELTNRSEAGARIAKLKNERKLLGNVNVGAIEEYERVSERYGFLSAQRDDLEKSAAELTDMIAGITARMRDIFGAQFKVINENFGETFTEIFGGGTAELSLDDPSDILNCGIEIRVQPPGKTLRTITLLSGGERAFVAIALYFAIMKVRPTPFCVLDEIEAALDDVNVVRYANYLRKLASTTQFIVITHRRGTMEEADVLYGVTMQDQGISKMLTISIAQVEEELHIKLK